MSVAAHCVRSTVPAGVAGAVAARIDGDRLSRRTRLHPDHARP